MEEELQVMKNGTSESFHCDLSEQFVGVVRDIETKMN